MRVIGGQGTEPAAGAWADAATVTFRVPDPGQRLAGVRLSQQVRIPGDAQALARAVLPALGRRLPASVRIGMGTSLGALAALHAHCRYLDAFDALFLQSGSFFRPRFDDHERWFPYYPRMVRFVASVPDGAVFAGRPVPTVLTCGAIEENVANNRLMTQALRARGYPAVLHEQPDTHNYTAWRDAFDPHLTRLLWQLNADDRRSR